MLVLFFLLECSKMLVVGKKCHTESRDDFRPKIYSSNIVLIYKMDNR